MGSPPPAGSKNVVLKFRSVNNIVMAPAKTGMASKSRIAVSRTLQTKRGSLSVTLILQMVVMKLIAPRILLIPAICREKIPKSTARPCPIFERGGYMVQPVPIPPSTTEDDIRSNKEGGSSQKLKLFSRGKAISGAFTINGINQLPKPPIMVGITKKKIITKACDVTMTLYN